MAKISNRGLPSSSCYGDRQYVLSVSSIPMRLESGGMLPTGWDQPFSTRISLQLFFFDALPNHIDQHSLNQRKALTDDFGNIFFENISQVIVLLA